MSNAAQRTTSATHEDDVIRPKLVTAVQLPTMPAEVADVDLQSPSEAEVEVETTTTESKRQPWPRPTRAPKIDRPAPLTGGKVAVLWFQRTLVFIARVLTLGLVSVRRISNPKISRKDQQDYALKARQKRLKRNAVRRPRKVVVVNPKGGVGKTPTTVYLAVFAQAYTGNSCTLIDMNQNYGSTWRWVGVSQSDTITVYEAVTGKPFSHVDEFNAVTAIHESGLRFIGSEDMDTTIAISRIINEKDDQNTMDDEEKRLRVFRRFRAFIQNIKRFSHSVFIDTGNGMSHASHTAAVDAADVLVFPANWNNDDDIAGIQEGVHGYINRGYGPKLRQRAFYMVYGTPDIKKEVLYKKFCERVFAAYLAANFKKNSYAEMDPLYREQKAREYAENLGITIDRLYPVPWSDYIAQKHVASSDVNKVGKPTALAITSVADDIYALNIDGDPEESDSTADIDEQLEKLYQEMQGEITATTA